MSRRPLVAVAAAILASAVLPAAAGATATASLAGTTLTIAGDAADDTIALTPSGADLAIDLDGNGTVDATFDRGLFDTVVVDTGAGDDRITGANGLAGDAYTLRGGPGADRLVGTDGGDVLDGGPGADVVDGARGNDQVAGGDGADTFDWSPGDGSDVVAGGPGDDLMVFNGANIAEVFDLSSDGAGTARLTRDVANITMTLQGLERLDVRMLAGADTFTGHAGVAAVLPTVALDGGIGTDTLTGGDEADTLIGGPDADTLNGGAGDDRFPVTAADSGASTDTVDGGTGDDTLAFTGTDADEAYGADAPAPGALTLSETSAGIGFATSNVERIAIDALGGNDTLALTPAAAAAIAVDASGGAGNDTLTGGALGDRLDGGPGTDRLTGQGGDDMLIGGPGDDLLTGGAGADRFSCGGLGDVLDATAQDTVDADCLAPVAPPAPPAPPAPVTVIRTVPVLAPRDTVAPAVRLLGLPSRVKRSALLRSGLAFRVASGEPAALAAELLATARSARIAAANLTLARRTLPAAGGTRRITLRPSRALVGRARRFTLTVRVTATDAAGNRRTVERRVKVT